MQRLEFIGATLFLSGILLFGLVHLAIANYVPNMVGWSDPPGKLETVRKEIMLNTPYFLSVFLIIVGGLILFLKVIKALIVKRSE
ncbi:hypothetical protein ACLIA0_06760 [Bacillaceae bacterium W0354]